MWRISETGTIRKLRSGESLSPLCQTGVLCREKGTVTTSWFQRGSLKHSSSYTAANSMIHSQEPKLPKGLHSSEMPQKPPLLASITKGLWLPFQVIHLSHTHTSAHTRHQRSWNTPFKASTAGKKKSGNLEFIHIVNYSRGGKSIYVRSAYLGVFILPFLLM